MIGAVAMHTDFKINTFYDCNDVVLAPSSQAVRAVLVHAAVSFPTLELKN